MKTKLLSGLFSLGLFASFVVPADAQGTPAAPASTPAAPVAVPGEIIIARARGEVFVTVKATSVKTQLQNNAKIGQGSVVSTGKSSSVVLVFSNGATINLGADSNLDIEQFTQDPFSSKVSMADITEEPSRSTTKLNLTHGELVGKVAKLKKEQGSSFTVGTPAGAAGIRGTVFQIVYIPDGNGHATFTMTCLEGNVLVTVATGTVNVSTTASVTAGQAITSTVDITTNSTTGVISVTSNIPSTVAPATTASLTTITDAAQLITQAVANVVIVTPAAPAAAPAAPVVTPAASPQPAVNLKLTTSGDGAPQ